MSSYPTGKPGRLRQAGQVRNASIAFAKWLLHHNKEPWAVQEEKGERNFTHLGASGVPCADWSHWSGPDSSQLEDRYEFRRKKRPRIVIFSCMPLALLKGKPIF